MLAAKQGEHTCTRCQETKPYTSFNRDSSRRLGIRLTCKACQSASRKAYYKLNAAEERRAAMEFYRANADSLKQAAKDWRSNNKDAVKKYNAAYTIENSARLNERRRIQNQSPQVIASIRDRERLWRANNPRTTNLRNARYRAHKKDRRRPFDDEFLRLVEAEAFDLSTRREKLTGVEWNVDHIVPLQSPSVQGLDLGSPIQRSRFYGPLVKIVTGLHNEFNLAVIPKVDNVRKSNRVWPDMP